MKKLSCTLLALALIFALVPVLLAPAVLAEEITDMPATIEPPISVEPPVFSPWYLSMSADRAMVDAGESINFTVALNVPVIIAPYNAATVFVVLPPELEYSGCIMFLGGAPYIMVTSPAVTPAGTSLAFDMSAGLLADALGSSLEILVSATVRPTWDGSDFVAKAELYKKMPDGQLTDFPSEQAAVLVSRVPPATYTVYFDLTGGTRIGGGPIYQVVQAGGAAYPPLVYREGFTFKEWDGAFYYVESDLVVTATWYILPDIGEITVDPLPDKPAPVKGFFPGHRDKFEKGGFMPLVYVASNEFSRFGEVRIDNTTIKQGSQYKVSNGSTIVTLLPEYLETLKPGSYELTVHFTDSSVSTAKFEVAEFKNPYKDVDKKDWFYSGVAAVTASGLMAGIDTDKFGPEITLNRGMLVTILYRYVGEPKVNVLRNPFWDVEEGQYYTDAVLWGSATGLIKGVKLDEFQPKTAITREQFAAILYRYQNSAGLRPLDILADREYSDFDKISDYAKSAVTKLTMQGVFRDWPADAENGFNPRTPMTRAEIATGLWQWIQSLQRQ